MADNEITRPKGFYRIVITVTAITSAVAAIILMAFFYQVIRPLPYEFTSDIFEATPGEVCPGETVTYERGAAIEGEATALLSAVWLDPRNGRALNPTRLGDALAFAWRSHEHLSDYYIEQGHPIVVQSYPLVITRTLTATVPITADNDAPLVLEVSTIVGTPARYSVPVWVKAAGECDT